MIIRTENRNRYTIISNELLNDANISDKARGLLARLLSKPDNWNLNINQLAKTGKTGQTTIRSSIAELERAGYIHRRTTRNNTGRITGTEYMVYECPLTPLQALKQKTDKAIMSPVDPPVVSYDPVVETTTYGETNIKGNRMQKTRMRESSHVINTDNKQILRITTTTTPDPAVEPEIQAEVEQSSRSSYPATKPLNDIFNTLPKQYQQPMVKALINRALELYSVSEIQEAIAYSSANVRGGFMQFKAYLDKTLKNKWADGYMDVMLEGLCSHAMYSPGGFTKGACEKFPNGTVTGSSRMDSNYMAIAKFLDKRQGVNDDE